MRRSPDATGMLILSAVAALPFLGVTARAGFVFGIPVQLDPNVNSAAMELGFDISSDGLSLSFDFNGGNSSYDFATYVSTRASEREP